MNLALKEVRRHPGRFGGTAFGMALLFTVVLAMAGIYGGLVDDATLLVRSVKTDLWVVQKGTRGPFADISRLDPSVEARVASVPGVRHARSFTYQVLQRAHGARSLRFALVGVGWPDDRGAALPLVAGRELGQAHGELIVDASLGLPIGSALTLGDDEYRIVGLTRQFLASSGRRGARRDSGRCTAHRRVAARGRRADGARTARRAPPQDGPRTLAALARGRRRGPALAPARAPLPHHCRGARRTSTPLDRTTYAARSTAGRTSPSTRPRRRSGCSSTASSTSRADSSRCSRSILVLTSSVLIAAVIYMMTMQKTHDIAVLKLVGASRSRIAALVLQQAWLIGVVGYAIALAIGSQAFPHFPRRVLLTTTSVVGVGVLVLVVSTLASLLGVAYALRVDAGRALEA